MEDIKPPLGALVVIPGCAQNPLEPKQSQTKPLEEFHLFSKLPIELRLKIWGYTIIPRDNDLAVKPFDLVPSDIPPTRIEDITANHPNRFIEDGMYDEDDGTLNYSGGYCLMCDLSLDELRAQQDPFPIALRICRESRAQALTQCTLYKQTPLWNIFAIQLVLSREQPRKILRRPLCINKDKDVYYIDFHRGMNYFATMNFEELNSEHPDILGSMETLQIRKVWWDEESRHMLWEEGGPLKFCRNLKKLDIIQRHDGGGWENIPGQARNCQQEFIRFFNELKEKDDKRSVPEIQLIDFATYM
jgi:hypothetical protein